MAKKDLTEELDLLGDYKPKDERDLFADFDRQIQEMQSSQQATPQNDISQIRQQHPILSRLAEMLSSRPDLERAVQGAAPYAKGANTAIEASGLPALAGGALQGFGNAGISAVNLPWEMIAGKENKIPYLDLESKAPPSLFGRVPFKVGEVGGNLMADYALFKGMGKIPGIKSIPRPSGYSGLAQDMLKFGGAGFLTGDNEMGGRIGNALLSGIFGWIPGVTKGGVSNQISKDKKAIQDVYHKAYEKIFSTAEKAGHNKITPPRINVQKFTDELPSKYSKSLDAFMQKQDLRSAQSFQSDLGKYINDLTKRQTSLGLSSAENKMLSEAIDAQKKVRGKIFEGLNKVTGAKLGKQYQEVTKGYKKEVAPYLQNKSLKAFEKGELRAKKLPEKLLGNEKFQTQLGEKYPELALNATINKGLKGAGLLGLGAYGGSKVANWLFGDEE